MRVPELVPQVSGLTRLAIGAVEVRRRGGAAGGGNRLPHHREMSGARFVEAGDQTVDGSDPVGGCDHQVRPAAAG